MLMGLEVQVLRVATEDGKACCWQGGGKVAGLVVTHRSMFGLCLASGELVLLGGTRSKERMCVGASACMYH